MVDRASIDQFFEKFGCEASGRMGNNQREKND